MVGDQWVVVSDSGFPFLSKFYLRSVDAQEARHGDSYKMCSCEWVKHWSDDANFELRKTPARLWCVIKLDQVSIGPRVTGHWQLRDKLERSGWQNSQSTLNESHWRSLRPRASKPEETSRESSDSTVTLRQLELSQTEKFDSQLENFGGWYRFWRIRV